MYARLVTVMMSGTFLLTASAQMPPPVGPPLLPPPVGPPPAVVLPKQDEAAAPTPQAEVDRVLALLPKPAIGFVDFGCGDGRWCIAAAKRWGCKSTGVEIDQYRAAAAKEAVRKAGLENLVTIVCGDATTTDVQADVGVAYLYADVLEKLKPRIEKLEAFASYMHKPPIAATKNGDSWIYVRPKPVALPAVASWNNRQYTGPVCSNPNCGMCNSIRAQLATPVVQQPAASGYWVKRCQNGNCWMEWVPTP